jgi:hypothetical protein
MSRFRNAARGEADDPMGQLLLMNGTGFRFAGTLTP